MQTCMEGWTGGSETISGLCYARSASLAQEARWDRARNPRQGQNALLLLLECFPSAGLRRAPDTRTNQHDSVDHKPALT